MSWPPGSSGGLRTHFNLPNPVSEEQRTVANLSLQCRGDGVSSSANQDPHPSPNIETITNAHSLQTSDLRQRTVDSLAQDRFLSGTAHLQARFIGEMSTMEREVAAAMSLVRDAINDASDQGLDGAEIMLQVGARYSQGQRRPRHVHKATTTCIYEGVKFVPHSLSLNDLCLRH